MSSNSIVTMNLSDMDSVNMTHVNQKKPVVAAADKQQLVYSAKIDEKKKKDDNVKTVMDSTDIDDIFSNNDIAQHNSSAAAAAVAQVYQQPRQAVNAQSANSNLMNLTDEQIQAIFVGVCAMISFSDPVQDKLASFIPTFVSDITGSRSNTGLVVTGLVVAFIFYYGKRNSTSSRPVWY